MSLPSAVRIVEVGPRDGLQNEPNPVSVAARIALIEGLVDAGVKTVEARKPIENAPAVMPRSQPNSSRIGGNSSENAVRALTASAMVTNEIPITTQP